MSIQSKIERLYLAKDYNKFYVELLNFTSYIIRRYVTFPLDPMVFEDLRDALVVRSIDTLTMRPWQPGRSDFRSYIFSVTRNGISSFLHRYGREVSKEEVYSDTDSYHQDFTSFEIPNFSPEFVLLYPQSDGKLKKLFKDLVGEGEFNTAVWEILSLEDQNFMKVLFWKMLVKDV